MADVRVVVLELIAQRDAAAEVAAEEARPAALAVEAAVAAAAVVADVLAEGGADLHDAALHMVLISHMTDGYIPPGDLRSDRSMRCSKTGQSSTKPALTRAQSTCIYRSAGAGLHLWL